MEKEKITKVGAIKEFFNEPPVTMAEMVELKKDQAAFDEVAALAAEALGKELK